VECHVIFSHHKNGLIEGLLDEQTFTTMIVAFEIAKYLVEDAERVVVSVECAVG